MPPDDPPSFLGTGWAFPPEFLPQFLPASVALVSARTDIEQSLAILLSTLPGERAMLPEYGCDLTPLLFEPVTTSLATDIADRVRTSILYFEPRIVPEKVSVTADDTAAGRVLIEVQFRIVATNTRHNFVYPFHRREGTELP